MHIPKTLHVLILSVIFLLTANIASVLAQEDTPQSAFVGSWVNIVPDSVSADSINRLLIHIERADDDSYTSNLDSPNRGTFDIPFSETVVSGDSLSLEIKSPFVHFTGQLIAIASRIEGTWKEANQSFRMLFKPLTDSIAATLPKKHVPLDEKRPKANAADVKTPESIIEAVYDVISGPAGEEKNLDRLRSLFLPNARLIPTGRMGEQPQYRSYLVEEYIKNDLRNLSEQDFYEQNIHAETEHFGDIAQVFSTYEFSRSPDAEPLSRGISSFQLWYDGTRWWIVNLIWHTEREDTPIPERYLD